jgi:inorganic pyrophosphatase
MEVVPVPKAGTKTLSRLPAFDPTGDDLIAVIETPKGSPNKYDFDEEYRAFRLAAVMPEGTTFPYDFGFVPSTLAEDGDPLDVLVLLDSPVVVGCLVTVRLIGVIEAEQRETGGKWIRNDRLIAVATHAHTHQHIRALEELRPHMLDEVEDFFVHYNEMKGKEFRPLKRSGAKKAHKLVARSMKALQASRSGSKPRGGDDR